MPQDLGSILKKSLHAKADIVKIAAKRSKTMDDVMTMINFTHRHRETPLINHVLGPGRCHIPPGTPSGCRQSLHLALLFSISLQRQARWMPRPSSPT